MNIEIYQIQTKYINHDPNNDNTQVLCVLNVEYINTNVLLTDKSTQKKKHQSIYIGIHTNLMEKVSLSGRPDQAQNCTITNISMTSLGLKCLEGFNGGLTQSFMLEVRELNTQVSKAQNPSVKWCSLCAFHIKSNIFKCFLILFT